MRAAWVVVGMSLALATVARAEPATFGVGDVVYTHELKEALPNAFGGKDIFGRKRTIGLIELRYVGMDGGVAVFARRDTRIMTNETTMNRSGAVFGTVGGETVILSGVGHGPTIQALGPSEIAVRIDPAVDRMIVIDGTTLQVLEATPNRVTLDVPATSKKK